MENNLELPNNLMSFTEFDNYRKKLILDPKHSALLDLGNTNTYSFNQFLPHQDIIRIYEEEDGVYHNNSKVNRCNLVEDWLKFYEINSAYKNNIGFSKGVRNTLALLANHSFYKYKKWFIPKDVYPYYHNVINSNYIPSCSYSTLDLLNGPFYFNDDVNCEDYKNFLESEVVLITLPLKPLGASGNLLGLQNLKKLITNNLDKTFIIDAVYLNSSLSNITNNIDTNSFENIKYLLELYELGNVYLLFSLSKNWSMPNVMGITFIAKNMMRIRENFNNIVISEDNLKLAFLALNKYKLFPDYISNYHYEMRNLLDQYWQNTFNHSFFKNLKLSHKHANLTLQSGYLYYIDIEPEQLFKDNILVIPASSFGGQRGSVISILNNKLSKLV